MRTLKAIGLCGLCASVACSDANHAGGGGSVQFTASGEVLALGGYAFPPAEPGDPAFVDGWEISFDQVLVTIDNITALCEPRSLAHRSVRRPTPRSRASKARGQSTCTKAGRCPAKAAAMNKPSRSPRLDDQNLKGGAAFDASTRYAFGFDIVAASADAQPINQDAAGQANYETMQNNGWTVLYVGTATWHGSNCSTSSSYDFSQLPTQVHFEFGFASPTSYVNCQNPDNDPAKAFASEEHQSAAFRSKPTRPRWRKSRCTPIIHSGRAFSTIRRRISINSQRKRRMAASRWMTRAG